MHVGSRGIVVSIPKNNFVCYLLTWIYLCFSAEFISYTIFTIHTLHYTHTVHIFSVFGKFTVGTSICFVDKLLLYMVVEWIKGMAVKINIEKKKN